MFDVVGGFIYKAEPEGLMFKNTPRRLLTPHEKKNMTPTSGESRTKSVGCQAYKLPFYAFYLANIFHFVPYI
jgi:hypothetical protein